MNTNIVIEDLQNFNDLFAFRNLNNKHGKFRKKVARKFRIETLEKHRRGFNMFKE